MKTITIVLLLLSTAALAGGSYDPECNVGSCNETTNIQGQHSENKNRNRNDNINVAKGGEGGHGLGVGVGYGEGGAAKAEGGDATGGTAHSDAKSNATSAARSSSGSQANNAVSNDTSVSAESSNTSGNVTDNSSVTVEGDSYDFPVNTAFAPRSFSSLNCDAVFGFGSTTDDRSTSVGLPMPVFLEWLLGRRGIRADCELMRAASGLAQLDMKVASALAICGTKEMRNHFGRKAKGKNARIKACEKKMLELLRQDAELKALRTQVEDLLREREITQEAHDRALVEQQENCDEQTGRSFESCVQK